MSEKNLPEVQIDDKPEINPNNGSNENSGSNDTNINIHGQPGHPVGHGIPAQPKKKKSLLRRYGLFIILALVYSVIMIVLPDLGREALNMTWQNVLEMLLVLPPIFVLLGLLDVWVPREIMIKLTGKGSGIKGIIISLMLGSFAAGPLYAAFPVAAIMMKKGTKFSNIMIFIGAWSTTKIPLLLFEASALGPSFMLLRFALNIPVIFLLGFLVEKSLPHEEKKKIYLRAEVADT